MYMGAEGRGGKDYNMRGVYIYLIYGFCDVCLSFRGVR